MFFLIYDSFIDVIADYEAPGYRKYKITPQGKKPKIEISNPVFKSYKTDNFKSKTFPLWFIKLFQFFLLKRTYSSNDYLSPIKWDKIISQRPKFSPEDPFKLRWLKTEKIIYCYQSTSHFSEYPKNVCAFFTIAWWLSHYIPAPLAPLCMFFYGSSFKFPVPVDSIFVKFVKMKL